MVTSPIIPAAELRGVLESSAGIALIDAGRTRAAYETGHLPNARFADSNEHMSSAAVPNADASRGGRHPLPAIEAWCHTLGDWGIAPSTIVVVYDDQAGANAAARAWWMLRSVGHEQVRVLDGGLGAAIAAGIPLTSEPAAFTAAPPYPCNRWMRSTVDIDTVDALRTNPEWRVVDVRSAPRFAGVEEPIDPVAGHIPGAVNVPFTENLEDGQFKSAEALRELYGNRLSDSPPDHVVVHCGSGVTACHTLLALEIAGMHGASLFVGSWSEWCRNPRPREP